MVKKFTKQQLQSHQKRHRIIVGLSVVVIAVLVGLIFSLIVLPKITNDTRLSRINDIYSSVKLPENTYFNTDDIFGDKRPYPYDTSRTEASSKHFVVAKTVTETFNELDTSIKAAEYTLLEVGNPGSTSKEAHYKTTKGEYIRLNVSSKLRNDMASNEALMTGKLSTDFIKIDPNDGPSTVILKVNLDGNND